MYGAVSSSASILSLYEPMRYFKRFGDAREGSWGVCENNWDGLVFIPNRDIKVYGMGLF
jgi:hypothetical protein